MKECNIQVQVYTRCQGQNQMMEQNSNETLYTGRCKKSLGQDHLASRYCREQRLLDVQVVPTKHPLGLPARIAADVLKYHVGKVIN